MDVATRVQNPRLGIALLCTGVAFFGLGEACVKTLSKDYEILQVVWARYVFHALVFLLIFSRTGIISQMQTSRPFLHLARSITLMLGTVSFFTALIYLSLPEAVAINFAAPLLVTALSIPFLGEKVGPRRWAAIFVGFLGVLVIIRPGARRDALGRIPAADHGGLLRGLPDHDAHCGADRRHPDQPVLDIRRRLYRDVVYRPRLSGNHRMQPRGRSWSRPAPCSASGTTC